MTQSFCAIVNGAAGGGRCRARADKALDQLSKAGIDLDVHFTEGHDMRSSWPLPAMRKVTARSFP